MVYAVFPARVRCDQGFSEQSEETICKEVDVRIDDRYDLKGSSFMRSADPLPAEDRDSEQTRQKIPLGRCKYCHRKVMSRSQICNQAMNLHCILSRLYKDNDMNFSVSLSVAQLGHMTKQMELDTSFLRDCGVMDYSLLLGASPSIVLSIG